MFSNPLRSLDSSAVENFSRFGFGSLLLCAETLQGFWADALMECSLNQKWETNYSFCSAYWGWDQEAKCFSSRKDWSFDDRRLSMFSSWICFPLPNCSRRFNIMSGVIGSKWDALAFLKERWKLWHGRIENVFLPECCFLFWTAQDSVSCQVLDVANKMLFGFLKEGLNFWWHEGSNMFSWWMLFSFLNQLHEIHFHTRCCR